MWIYILDYILIAFFCLLKHKKYISKKRCIVLCCTVLWLTVGLRNISLGLIDTKEVYIKHYKEIYYNGLSVVSNEKDKLFYYITYFIIKITGYNPMVYLLIMAMPYIFSVGILINKYSKNIFLSFIIFMSIHYYEISFTLMRQVIAMAILLFSFDALKDKKLIKFILIVLLASLFHQMALVFLLAYPVSLLNEKNKKKFIIIIILSFIISIFLPSNVKKLANNFFDGNDRFSKYTTSTYSMTTNLILFFMCLLFTLVGMFYIRKQKKEEKKSNSDVDNLLLLMSILASSFAPFTTIIREFSRITYFFGIYNICILPNALNYEKNNNVKYILYYVSTIIFISYFLLNMGLEANIIPYKFYWQ